MHIHIPGLYFSDAVREEFNWFQEDFPRVANEIVAVRTAIIEHSCKAMVVDRKVIFDPVKLHPDDGWTERGLRHVANHEMAHVIWDWFICHGYTVPAARVPGITRYSRVSDKEMFCEVWAVYRTNPDKRSIEQGEKIVRKLERTAHA